MLAKKSTKTVNQTRSGSSADVGVRAGEGGIEGGDASDCGEAESGSAEEGEMGGGGDAATI